MGGDQVDSIPSLLRAVSRWLNVVLDLNGILCVCEEYRFLSKIQLWNLESNLHSSSILVKIGPKAVYVRPLCSTFLRAVSDFADITIWSSMRKPTRLPPDRFASTSSGDYKCPCISLGRIVVITPKPKKTQNSPLNQLKTIEVT